MPLTKKGKTILRQMLGTYKTEKKAKQVFHAMVNAGKLTRVHR